MLGCHACPLEGLSPQKWKVCSLWWALKRLSPWEGIARRGPYSLEALLLVQQVEKKTESSTFETNWISSAYFSGDRREAVLSSVVANMQTTF